MGRVTYSKEKITNIMRNKYSNPHVRKMEPVTPAGQRNRNRMMSNQLVPILPRFLETQDHDDALLRPVGQLEEVVEFEFPLQGFVREAFEHLRKSQ